MNNDRIRIEATLSGRVQGVFFRSETRETARRNGVSGWVRNTADGRVEAVFEGRARDVDQVVQWCRGGPPNARVDDLRLREEPYTGKFDTFSIRRETKENSKPKPQQQVPNSSEGLRAAFRQAGED